MVSKKVKRRSQRIMQVFGEWAQVEVVELWNDGSGLAFGIVGGRSSGVVVKSVLPGGVADRDGRLRSGDMLLRIGSVVVVGMCARQAAAVLRQCGAAVRLLVARPAHQPHTHQSLGSSPAPVIPSRLLADPIELERRLAEAGHDGFGALCEETTPPSPPPTIIEESMHHRPVASIVAVVPRGALSTPRPPPALTPAPPHPHPHPPRLPLDMAVRGSSEPETLSYDVQLNKNCLGLGITVAGYVCEQEELSGIFVKSISEGSSADLCGTMQVNDRIVEVDGVSLNGVTNHRAVALLRDAKGPLVRLKALRYLRGAGFERLQKALAAQGGKRPASPASPASPAAPPSPSVTSLAKYSFSVYDESTVIETEADSFAHLPSPPAEGEDDEIVIGREGQGQGQGQGEGEARRVQDKWRDILARDTAWPGHRHHYDIVVGTIIRDKEAGLGISLEGTVRVVAGKEVQARHYIRALAPQGPAASSGLFRRGDELLEVNGWRVLGAHHVSVVSRLRAAADPTTLVVVRTRPAPSPPPAPSAPPAAMHSSVLGGSLQQLAPPPARLIKAKSESSVTSLCSTDTALSHQHSEFCSEDLERNRSRSLEPLSGLAMWADEVEYIDLVKEDRGLGFSILDYLDPSDSSRSVIVVRSVVAGGAAARHGRLAPGDRLVSVNGQRCADSTLAAAVGAIKGAPAGIVRIGICKPLPCSTVVGGERADGRNSLHSSQECINSLASDDHTGMDSFHECLQEYGEGIEVVQICLEPEEPSIKDDELSALGDLSFEDCKKDKIAKMNGHDHSKSDSLDEHDDDMTITEDDVLTTPRELPDLRIKTDKGDLIKQQSKEISTSDEMVFAVTPTGLERISFGKYWKEDPTKTSLEKVKSDESWKECLNSPDDTISFYEATKISVQDSNLLYIDHEIDGYETCIEDESIKNGHKIEIKDECKQTIETKEVKQTKDFEYNEIHDRKTDFNEVSYPYVQEHIIKQMKSLRIEPINVNIAKKKSPTKETPMHIDYKEPKSIQIVEYYNDQAECLKEINQQKLEEKKQVQKTVNASQEKQVQKTPGASQMEKKLQLKIQEPSDESTDPENYVDGCHKCFLENYAYAITTAYLSEASSCKYCEVIRDMLEVSKAASRRMSAPALVHLDSSTETEDEEYLAVPTVTHRRKSAGPLKFLVPPRRPSFVPHSNMTVSANCERRGETLVAQRWGPARKVTIQRSPGAPLGVSIVGGKVDIISNRDGEEGEEKAIFGIFIKNVVADSPAGRCGELKTGDRILAVDATCVRSAPHERCVELIKAAGAELTLTVQSLLAWNTESSDVEESSPARSAAVKSPSKARSPTRSTKSPAKTPSRSPAPAAETTPQHEITITVTSEPEPEPKLEEREKVEPAETMPAETKPAETKPIYSDDDESSDEEDEREMQGRTYTDKGVEIDRASAGAIKRSKEEKEADPEEEDDFGYTTNKIRKKYASLGDSVVVVRLERSAKGGLGLSLAGHRDRSRMAVFICGLNPAGSAAKASPAVKVGDEILEVNGIVLHGRCHLNASAIIKGLVGPTFKIILLRRKSALEDVAVKPLTATQFPVALDEESEDRFAGYKGVRDITVKKGPSGLGIMIIEGRHTEAGRGIFVSDLQEGSAAEQAGVQIGDMLLAVNRDSLLNCTYDAAAGKLKQAEGVLVLTVCSPNLKEPDHAAGGPSRPASRNQTPDPGAARPVTPRPAPSPVKAEPPPDPSVAPIVPNTDMSIEIASGGAALGVVLLGGSDTLINGAAAIILDIYKDGCIAKDGRLQVGDQILDCNGVPITKEMAHERVCLTIKQKTPKLRLLVHRPEPLKLSVVEVELARKPAKPLGLTCLARLAPPATPATPATPVPPVPALYLGDMLAGSPAALDGRLQKGDLLVSLDGAELSGADLLTAAAAFKLCGNKVNIKVKRFKTVR